ncbi:hypothetical protein LCGC14_2016200 [marine sediment metagenome]|uniref:Uncharacterized protein n=1 Tax=marine sediment metagenome TaxID=412755 RepID=A0A0F9FLE2_9ZZZZ
MKVSLSITNTYVPEWRCNTSLPEAEQLRVTYRLMTAEQEERFSTMYLRREGEDDFGMTVQPHAVEIWGECVTAVANLEDLDGKPITDAKKVLDIPGVYELVTEVVAIIKRGVTEADSKN